MAIGLYPKCFSIGTKAFSDQNSNPKMTKAVITEEATWVTVRNMQREFCSVPLCSAEGSAEWHKLTERERQQPIRSQNRVFTQERCKSGTTPRSPGLSFRSAGGWQGAGALLAVTWKKLEPALVVARSSHEGLVMVILKFRTVPVLYSQSCPLLGFSQRA